MRAVWTRARSDLRRHMRSAIVLAVLIGLTSALALAAAEGAQRTDTAYARLRVAVNAPDEIVASGTGPAEALVSHVDFSQVALLPQVKATRQMAYMLGEGAGADGKVLFGGVGQGSSVLGAPTIAEQSAMPWKVLEGRLPDPTRSDEVVIGYAAQVDPQAAVGSTIDLRLLKASVTAEDIASASSPDVVATLLGPPIPVKVVGRVAILDGQNELSGNGNHEFVVSPAFVQRYQPSTLKIDSLMVTLKNGQADSAAFERELHALYPTASVTSTAGEAAVLRRAGNVMVAALWVLALLTIVVGFMIFGQALSRLNFTESTENPILSALGMTRRQLFAVAMVRAAVIGAGAAVVAFIGAVAVSSLLPTGLARIVEPTPGTDVALIVIGGALCVPFGVLLLSVVPALRAARVRGDTQGVALVAEFRRPSAIAAFVARSGLPTSAATGVRLALEPGRGRTSVPVRSAVVGLALALMALTAAFGFSASFQHLVATPRLYGEFGNFGGGLPFGGGYEEAIAAMAADPGLSDVTVGNFKEAVDMQGPGGSVEVNVWGLDLLKGSLTPTMVKGSWPLKEGEVVLGGKTMRKVGAAIGDTVQVRSGDTIVPLKVVGQAVFGTGGFGPGLAEGAGMTFSQEQAFFPQEPRTQFFANLAPGAIGADVSARLNPLFAPLGAAVMSVQDAQAAGLYPTESAVVASFGSAQWIPLALSGLLALAAIGTLVHTLVTSVRRRRRDLAVLKTLGFVRRQVSATVAWQATTLAGIALLIGLPLGVALGRWGWTLFANSIGVLPVPVIDLRFVLLLIPVTLILANLIALVPGRLAASTQPAAALKAE
jgi:ABC-type antimicrobial peptide transport system permease subunit